MSKWPMKTSGLNSDGSEPQRGACIECREESTKDEVLISFDCKGCVCARCSRLPQYAKRLAA
jgi:hypothetical protein